jgi:hypothetical protein
MFQQTNHPTILGIAIVALLLLGCTSGAAETADYLPRPHLAISIIDPSNVLIHHSSGDMLFDTQLGIGGEGIFPDVAYNGFRRSLDVFEDGSVVLVPVVENGRQTTGMFVNLPSGRKFLFTQDGSARQLSAKAHVRVFALTDHRSHDWIAHFPDFEN